MDCRQNFFRCKNNARFNSLVTLVDSNLGFLFEIQRNFANSRELQVNWILLRTLSKPDTSKSKLQHELENISSILRNNGYPESIIYITITKKIALFNRKPNKGPQKCPVYLKLP